MSAFFGGICFLLGLQLLYTWALTPRSAACLHILIAGKECPNLEQLIRWCKASICWGLWLGKGELLLVGRDVEPEQKEVMESFCSRYSYISCCDISQLEKVLSAKVYSQVRIVCDGQFVLMN